MLPGNYDLRAISARATAAERLGSKLHQACYAANEAEALRLIEEGADVNYISKANQQSPLHQCAIRGLRTAGLKLIERGARLDLRDYYDRTPLDAARELGHPECVQPWRRAANQREEAPSSCPPSPPDVDQSAADDADEETGMDAIDAVPAAFDWDAGAGADTIFFASTAARPHDALADIAATLDASWLTRAPKSLQGQVLFTVRAAVPPAALAARLLRLRTLDYIHVMLVSCDLGENLGGSCDLGENLGEKLLPGGTHASIEVPSLVAVLEAARAVPRSRFGAALTLWRALTAADTCSTADRREAAATLPDRALVFRAVGKRGGKGHSFSSDEAKRAAKRGLTEATGCLGSTGTYHFEVLSQVRSPLISLVVCPGLPLIALD
jgi:hypothetical protein